MIQSTSLEAFASIQPTRATVAAQILEQIRACGIHGACCDELEAAHGYTHQCCSARFTELANRGEIIMSGEVRKTRSGRNANVWIAKDLWTP